MESFRSLKTISLLSSLNILLLLFKHNFFKILLFLLPMAIESSILPILAEQSPTHTIPYPTQLIPGDKECLILPKPPEDKDEDKNNRNLTPQEDYANDNWLPREKDIWHDLCEDGVVDFEQYKEKSISPDFLEIILLKEPFRSALPDKVIIKSAIVEDKEECQDKDGCENKDDLDLSTSIIDKELNFENSTFKGKVRFFNTRVERSLYFKDSEFKKTLELNDSVIKGSLFLKGVKFNISEEFLNEFLGDLSTNGSKDKVIINLRKIHVEDDINLQGTELIFPSSSPDTRIRKEDFGLKSLGLLGATVGGSIKMQDANFNKRYNFASWCNQLELTSSKGSCGEVELIAVKVGDAIIFNLTPTIYGPPNYYLTIDNLTIHDKGTKFIKLNLTNVQTNKLLIKVPLQISELLTSRKQKLRIYQYLTRQLDQDQEKEIKKLSFIVSNKINMKNLSANSFQVERDNSFKKDNFFNKDEDLPKNDKTCVEEKHEINDNGEEELKIIYNLALDGFRYENANISSLNLIIVCLEQQYTYLEKNKDKASVSLDLYSQLLQPFEQVSQITRTLGRYPIEQQLLYRRKKLELFIAEKLELRLEYFNLKLADLIYGFGYQRQNGFILFGIFCGIGIFFAWYEIDRKQREMVKNSVESSKCEIEDERIEAPKGGCCGQIKFAEIFPYIDSIQRIVFQGEVDNNGIRKSKIYVVFKKGFNLEEIFDGITSFKENEKEYVRLELGDEGDKNIKILTNILDLRVLNNTKVGFCENLFPETGLWLVYENKQTNRYQLYNVYAEKYYRDFACWDLTRKRLLRSLIFSVDILIPIIDLDEELYNFTFQHSKSWVRAYFISQKLIAALIAGILLPILFISGL